MNYYSTNRKSPNVGLWKAISEGIASDGGLYLPERLPWIPAAFFKNLPDLKLEEIGYVVANTLFGDDVDSRSLKNLVADALNFEMPLRHLNDRIYVLEQFHGPTNSGKDPSSRFMAGLINFLAQRNGIYEPIDIIVATSGDAGAAVANAFRDFPMTRVHVVFPKGKLSRQALLKLASIKSNVRAVEVEGSYDDCRKMVYKALVDKDLRQTKRLISANSLNIARLMPQIIVYYWAYALLVNRLGANNVNSRLAFAVPCGNLGNICAGIIGERMGLPARHFIVSNYGESSLAYPLERNAGEYSNNSISKLAADGLRVDNSGDDHLPSNTTRLLNLMEQGEDVTDIVDSFNSSPDAVAESIKQLYADTGYILEPQAAACRLSLLQSLSEGEIGVVFAPNHPKKYAEAIKKLTGIDVPTVWRSTSAQKDSPAGQSQCHTVTLAPTFSAFKRYLLNC